MRSIRLCACLLVLASLPVAAQAPTPDPVLAPLRLLEGTWTHTRELKASDLGSAGTATGTDVNELLGGFFLVRRYEESGVAGTVTGIDIVGYDAQRQTFTNTFFNSTGASGSGTLSIRDNVWTFIATGVARGQSFHQRCLLTLESPATSFTMACDVSRDGQQWTPRSEGRWTKVTRDED